MSQQEVLAFQEKMAVMVEVHVDPGQVKNHDQNVYFHIPGWLVKSFEDSMGRMGGTTAESIYEEEATGILSIRSKGKGKEIKIDGVNYNIDTDHPSKTSELNCYNVPGPALIGLQKESQRPEVKCLERYKVNTVLPHKKEQETIYQGSQNKFLQPRPESSVPPKKRNSPYHQTVNKRHDNMEKRDLREMKMKVDETPINPTEELNQLLVKIIKSYIQNKTPIKIDGEPHHLTATPVEAVRSQSTTHQEGLYAGIVDRPPPSSYVVRNHGIEGDLSENFASNQVFESEMSGNFVRNHGFESEMSGNFVRNHGPEGTLSIINIPEEEVEDMMINESHIMPYQCEDFEQNSGECDTNEHRLVISSSIPNGDAQLQYHHYYNETHENVEENTYKDSFIEAEDDQPLDLSYKTSAIPQCEVEVETTVETEVQTTVETEKMDNERVEVSRPVFDSDVYVNKLDSSTAENSNQVVMNSQQLQLLLALHFERLKMKTPEPRQAMSTHNPWIISTSQNPSSKTTYSIPGNTQNTQKMAANNEQKSSEMTANVDEKSTVVAAMPNLASLDMTHSDGSVKESKGEFVKRRLKNKLKK